MKPVSFLFLGMLLSFPGSVWSLSSDLAVDQLNHRVFTATDGAPSDIDALAQTSDGTLWVGGRAGLSRFDGVRFVPYPARGEEPLQGGSVSALTAAPDGGLWIALRGSGLALLKNGRVTHYGTHDGIPEGAVERFAWDPDGTLWAAARLGVVHFKNNRWEKIADPRLSVVYGVLVDRSGTLWVGTPDMIFARAAGESQFRAVGKSDGSTVRGYVLTEGPDGSVWAVNARTMVRIDQAVAPDHVVAIRGIFGRNMLFDHEGNLWLGDDYSEGLLRLSAESVRRVARSELKVQPDEYSRARALDSERTRILLEDREHNIWIGSYATLHRFSRSNVVQNAAPPCLESLDRAAAFAAGDAGTLWMACSGQLTEMRDGAVVASQKTPDFSAAYRDRDGTAWFGGPTALGHIENGRLVTTPVPAKVRGRPVQALVRDSTGALWVSVVRRALYRIDDGVWVEYGNLRGLPATYPIVMTADDNGVLWFGYLDDRVARVSGEHVQLFGKKEGLEVGTVLSITTHAGEVWVGGDLGLARFHGAGFAAIHSVSGTSFKGTAGMVTVSNGDVWLNSTAGIVHIAHAEIERSLRDPAHLIECETFNYLDGVPGTSVQMRPQPSAIETTEGRIWFSMTGGIVSIDTARLVRNTLPPPVTIWSLTSNAQRYPNRGVTLQLPMHTTGLQIEYSAASLTVPERVRFRYKLEGSDNEWQDVGTRREALYTNLGPGQYTFRVVASNNDGVWNTTGASIAFAIAPAFYQTWWFYALCVLAGLAMLTALYRVRVRQVAAQVRSRLEARLSERERIARELHDTLLQGMQGLIFRFQGATDRIPASEPARQLLEQSLDRADGLLAESRDKVKGLRPSADAVADLVQALAAEGEQFASLHPAKFRVSVEGAARDLHPIVREEGFFIAREALANAFQHSRAENIEVEIIYGERMLHIRVRDDGQGIGAAVLEAGGRPGHFGMTGMRERATKLGGQVEVWSNVGAGTEVDLRVPARVAYRRSQSVSRGLRSWLDAFRTSDEEH
jgi:signal transduction histidine kinase/ligand-binding sensor domain-containing protein